MTSSLIAVVRLSCLWVLLYYEINQASFIGLLPLALINYPEIALYHHFRQIAASAYGILDVIALSLMVSVGSVLIGLIIAVPLAWIAKSPALQR